MNRILIVDDHVDLAENLAEILDGAGYQTVVAPSAEAALERVQAGDIAAVITDYRLPGRSGAQLVAELRNRGFQLPVVVMSAFTDDETIQRARAAGAAEVLAKPVPLDRLMDLVAEMSNGAPPVLLVDDNRELVENLAEALRARGHRAAICSTVAEALALTDVPTAAVLDYRLPDGTGVDVARRLRERNPQVRLLFMSSFVPELEARFGGELGQSTSCLDKPVDLERLLAWVAEGMARGATERPHR